ncbi:MAG: hypothetical protein CSB06_00870 [Bacteroidia bacterium]|nr:MAG: hypothetical protein CSB06_00870 [Bacteroidia bacterium]
MFRILFLISLFLLILALLALGVQTFFSKKGTFPDTSIGRNKELRKRKIYCIKNQQALLDKNYKLKKGEEHICDGSGC